MAQPPPDVEGDDCLPEYHHLFCPDLLQDKVAFITGGFWDWLPDRRDFHEAWLPHCHRRQESAESDHGC